MSAGVENPQAIFDNWFELINDNGPGQTLFTFGVEGKTYKTVDGVKNFLPTILNPDSVYNKVWIDPSLVVTTFAPEFVADPLTQPSHAVFKADKVQYQLPSASEELGKLVTEINVIKMNVIAEIVFGDLTLDEGMAKYKSEISKYIHDGG